MLNRGTLLKTVAATSKPGLAHAAASGPALFKAEDAGLLVDRGVAAAFPN